MPGFEPTLFDKLADCEADDALIQRYSVDELKDALARDLEALLNSRRVIDATLLDDYPEAGRSILTYGLNDFSSASLSSVHDRERICAAIRHAIEVNEPRLQQVHVWLDPDRRAAKQLMFSIKAWLMLKPAGERVGFDAMLQPTTLRYAVASRRIPCFQA